MHERLTELLDRLDAASEETVGTSVRLPVNLRDAAALAVALGLTTSTTDVTVRGLRDALEAHAQRAVLDAHYAAHPQARPGLAEVALATAEIDGNPIAARADLIHRATAEISITDAPTPKDVLVYAAGLASVAA